MSKLPDAIDKSVMSSPYCLAVSGWTCANPTEAFPPRALYKNLRGFLNLNRLLSPKSLSRPIIPRQDLINNLFKSDEIVLHSENIQPNIITYEEGNPNIGEEEFKFAIKERLKNYDKINMKQYYDFTNTIMYRHLIIDNNVDTLSLGKQLINKIKEYLNHILSKILIEGTRQPLIEVYNVFNFKALY